MKQEYLPGFKEDRSLLDQLLSDSQLYKQSSDYRELLQFITQLRGFAPFNALLLQIQKPGITYAATVRDWYEKFGRNPKEGARPLLILWPFGPVALVYDVLDTEGDDLPWDVFVFPARGDISEDEIRAFQKLLTKKRTEWYPVDMGDGSAGSMEITRRAGKDGEYGYYRVNVNMNQKPVVQFATLAHELGHLFLGHLGKDSELKIPERPRPSHRQEELEAESVAYLVCARNGVTSKSQTYLAEYVEKNTTVDNLDIYQVMRAAGQVETLLGLSAADKQKERERGAHGTAIAHPQGA